MRIPLKELLEKMGVQRVLGPYETQPWLVYDDKRGITASAEVRAGPDLTDIEAEIQFIYDSGESRDDSEEETGDGDKDGDGSDDFSWSRSSGGDAPRPKTIIHEGIEQILIMRCLPVGQAGEDVWGVKYLIVKGNDYEQAFHGWEDKGCEFFKSCAAAMQMGDLPDIEDLLEKSLNESDSWGGGRRGRIGRKSPKIKPAQLLGMKKPM